MSEDGLSEAGIDLLPPQEMIDFVGEGDFRLVGETFLIYLKKLGGLKPHESILDLGCGCGRMAIPLTRYLDTTGAYHGLDIYKDGIEWCAEHITSKFPNFRFQSVDIYNKRYNPGGNESASSFRFPYQDDHFDVVFAASVFTHLCKKEMLWYLSEISRVLKKNGRCLVSFFLFNETAKYDVDPKRNNLEFNYVFGEYRAEREDDLEYAIAYDEKFIRTSCYNNKLWIREPITYGLQDVVTAVKIGNPWILAANACWHKLRKPVIERRAGKRASKSAVRVRPRNGLWTDTSDKLHLLIQTYENEDCVIVATLDLERFVVFRGPMLGNKVCFSDDVGQQGFTLTLNLLNPLKGNVDACLPGDDVKTEVSLAVPAINTGTSVTY